MRAPDALQELPGAGAALAPADAPPGAAGLQAEGDVLGDGQVGEQGRLLVDRGDARGPASRAGSLPVDGLPADRAVPLSARRAPVMT